jgi:mycothiol synthase
MIELREARGDDDLERWLEVRRAVLPRERTATLEEQKAFVRPGDLYLLAFVDGELAGSGLCNKSDTGGAFLAPRVVPGHRGRGAGAALLRRLAAHAVERGFERAGSHVNGADERSIAFARRFGFEERRRDVQQVLVVEPRMPRDVAGVEFVPVASRPELVERAYAEVAQQGYEDLPIDGVDISLDAWLLEEASLPEGSFVALAADAIVGYAGLCEWPGDPTKAEHGLTVVRRDWRGRGVAAALKERQIAWAAANGIRELVTWTQTGNENMQAVNAKLGYELRESSIAFGRDLPLNA